MNIIQNNADNLSKYLISSKSYSLLATKEKGELILSGSNHDPNFTYPVVEVPELKKLATHFDRVLVRSDGIEFTIYCINDATGSNKPISLTPKEIIAIGKDCSIYTGKVSSAKVPVQIYIVELWDTQHPGTKNIKAYKKQSFFGKQKVNIGVLSLNIETKKLDWYGNALLESLGIKKYAKGQISQSSENKGTYHLSVRREIPAITIGLIVSFICIFIVSLFASNSFFEPSNITLIKMGANNFELVKNGDFFRLLSSAFLHGGFSHLIFNCIAMGIAGKALERYLGYRWFLSIFILSAIGGSIFSIVLGEYALSVGASGGILGLISASFIMSNKLPYGAERTQIRMDTLYMLVASFLPAAVSSLNIDYAAHAGGAIVGFLISSLIYVTWPKDSSNPPLKILSTFLAIISVVLIIISSLKTFSAYNEISMEERLLSNQENITENPYFKQEQDPSYLNQNNETELYSYEFLNSALNENGS